MALTQVPGSMMQSSTVTPTQLNTQSQYTGFKNRIINGAMVIDQRNSGASQTTSTTSTYMVDRWYNSNSQNTKYTVQQNAGSVTPPVGFTNYQGATSTSAYSVNSSDFFFIAQNIEGYNISDFAWGTANAKTVTLSFWVQSSLTGTFAGSLRNGAANRSYPFSYTIASANTWTQIAITIPGDTSGTWLTNNGIGVYVSFSLGSGSNFVGTVNTWQAGNLISVTGAVSVVGTSGATFYITGVQLEVGSTATSFDVRDYGRELILCQRYYQSSGYPSTGFFNVSGATAFFSPICFKVSMRTAPTVTLPSSSGNVVLDYTNTPTTPTYQWGAGNVTVDTFAIRAGCPNIGGIVAGTFTASAEL